MSDVRDCVSFVRHLALEAAFHRRKCLVRVCPERIWRFHIQTNGAGMAGMTDSDYDAGLIE
jgi:hypothetical protein